MTTAVNRCPQPGGMRGQQMPTRFFACKRRLHLPNAVLHARAKLGVTNRGLEDRRARGRLLSGASIWIAQERHDSSFIQHAGILSHSELQDARAYRHDGQRRRTMVGKVLLRLALSQTVDNTIAPADWQLTRDGLGKPKLAQSSLPLRFSISHNENVTVVAVSHRLDVGVDVESADQVIFPGVVRDFLTVREHAILRESDPETQREAAIRLWTLKEAYTKMVGLGLGLEFSAIDLGPGHCQEPPGIISATLHDWTLTLADSARCQLALALGGQPAASETNIFTIGSQGQALLF